MAQYDGSIRINTKIDTREFRLGEKAIQGSVDRITSSLKKMTAVIASAFAVGKLVQFGKEALQVASDFEAMEAQFSQVFGELEADASKSLSGIAKQAGIAEERMKASYTKIAAFAKTTGMDAAGSMELANRAMTAVADSAAFYDRSLEETTESLQSFLKGNYENDAALGLSATEFTRNAAANRLYGKSFMELSEAQKQLTLLQMVEDANRLSGALGQASREADTWTNQTGNLSQAWINLKANLGKLVLPVAIQAVKSVTTVINAINAMISRISTAAGAFRSFSELLTGKKSSSGTGLPESGMADASEGYNSAADAADNLASSTKKAAKATKDAQKAAEGYLSPLDEINKFSKEEGVFAGKGDSGSGIGTGSGALGAGVDYGRLAEGETVVDKLDKKLLELKEILSGIIRPFKEAWESEGESTVKAARFALSSLGELVRSVAKSFYEVWTNGTGTQTLELILKIAQNVLITIGNIAQRLNEAWNTNDVGTSIIQNIFNIYNTILSTIERITGATAEWARTLDFTPLLTSINRLLEAIQPLTQNIGSGIAWFYENVLLPLAGFTIEEIIPRFFDTLSAALKIANEVLNELKPLFQWFWDKVLLPVAQWTGGMFLSAWDGIIDVLTRFGDWLSEHQEVVQGFAVALGALFSASLAAKILSAAASLGEYIINAGGLVAALQTITASLFSNTAAWFSNTAAKIADKAETLAIIGLYAKDFIVNLAKGTAALVKQAAQFAVNTAAKIADTAAQVAMTAATVAWNAVCALATAATTALGAAIAFLTSPIGIAITAIGAIIAIGILLYKNWGEISAKAKEVWDFVKRKFEEFSIWLQNVFKRDWTKSFGSIGEVFNVFFKNISNIWNSIKKIFEGIITFVSGVFSGNWKKAWDGIKTIFKGIWDGLESIVKSPVNAIIGIINSLISGVASAVNGISNMLNSLSFDIPDWLGGGSFHLNMPTWRPHKIPYLAQGTVVPPNREFMAVLGDNKREPEVVSPISTMKKAVKEAMSEMGGMGNNGTIIIKQYLEGKQVYETVIKNGKMQQMSTGNNPFMLGTI